MEWTPVFQSKASEFIQGDNWNLKFDNTIKPDQQPSGWEQYIRHTVAKFKCSKCKRTWPSNRVMVVFHFRLDNCTHQGTIKVRRYRQNCKRCTNAPMEQPSIDDDNIKILMDNLVNNIRKKCYHEDLGRGQRPNVGVFVKNPHEPDHCEGCIDGVCKRDTTSLPDLFSKLNL